MKKMPYKIKQKIRQVQSAYYRARELDMQLSKMFGDYGVDTDYLTACGRDPSMAQTEALAYVVNCEGDVEGNIEEIEEVFLEHVNNMN